MIEKLKNKGIIIAIIIISIALIGVAATKADLSLKELIANRTADKLANELVGKMNINVETETETDEEVEFGVFPGNEIYERVYFNAGFLGEKAINFDIAEFATSSAISGGSEERATTTSMWCYAGPKTIEVDNWGWRIARSAQWNTDISIGTTTCRGRIVGSNCGGAGETSLTNTTTATIAALGELGGAFSGLFDVYGYVDDRYTGFLDTGTNGGTGITTGATSTIGSYFTDRTVSGFSTTSPFTMSAGECIVVYNNQTGATSSDSYIYDGGYTSTTGSFWADAWYKDPSK